MREMMRSPMMVCWAMVSNSSRVSSAGLFRMLPGIPILPMSCSTAAYWSMRSSPSDRPRRLPTATAMVGQRVGVRGRVLVLGLHGRGQRRDRLEVHAVELLVGLGVLQGDGDLAADGGEQRQLLGPELMRVAEPDGEGPDHAFLARERHHQEAAQLVGRARQRAEVLVGLGVADLEAAAGEHGQGGELVGGRRRHGAPLAAAERRPRRVALVDEEHAGRVGVQHRADHVGEAPELGVRVRRLGQRGAEGAQVADLERQRLGLLGQTRRSAPRPGPTSC